MGRTVERDYGGESPRIPAMSNYLPAATRPPRAQPHGGEARAEREVRAKIKEEDRQTYLRQAGRQQAGIFRLLSCVVSMWCYSIRVAYASFWSFLRTLFLLSRGRGGGGRCVGLSLPGRFRTDDKTRTQYQQTHTHHTQLAEAHSEELLALVTTEDEVRAVRSSCGRRKTRASARNCGRSSRRRPRRRRAARREDQRHFDALLGITDDDDGTTAAAAAAAPFQMLSSSPRRRRRQRTPTTLSSPPPPVGGGASARSA